VTYDAWKATDDAGDDAEPLVRGCERAEGMFTGPRCDPWAGCTQAREPGDGCGCCYVHCLCEPADRDGE